jgi:lipoprotein-releasing system permease protein
MTVPFELQIALRYLFAKRKQALISVISFISIIGVGVGVAAVIIALAMTTGLQQEVRDRLLGANAHDYVWLKHGSDYRAEIDKFREIPHVVAAAPAIAGFGLLTLRAASQAVQIKGIDPALEQTVSDIGTAMKSGSISALEPAADSEELDGVLLGNEVAASLGASVGDVVQVYTPAGVGTPAGTMPIPRRLRVAGVFHLGLVEIDKTFAYVTLDAAKRLLRVEDVDLIQIRADNLDNARSIKEAVQGMPNVEFVEDWTDMNQQLYSALWLEKIAISLAIGLIIIVAALNIVGTLILLVMDKHRDIAILKTMGTTAKSVTLIFVLQGLIIGIVGTAFGGALGYVIARVMDRYQVIHLPEDVYQIAYLPFTVLPLDFSLVIAGAILICFVATIYPSRQAARLDPAQALRYE